MKNAMPVTLAAAISALLMGAAQGQVPVEAREVGAPVHTFSVSPAASAVQLRGQLQFSASTSDPVSWEVNGISGGSAEVGTITRAGLYTAPATLPKPFRLVVTARLIGEPKKSESALINLATGARAAAIAKSEGEKQAEINQAQGHASALLAIAEANAKAIRQVAEAIESPGGLQAVNLKVAEQYVAAFANIAKTNNTVIVPANLSDLAGLVTSAMTVFKAQAR